MWTDFLRVKFKEIEFVKSRRTGKRTRSKKLGTAHKFENSWDTSRGLRAATAIFEGENLKRGIFFAGPGGTEKEYYQRLPRTIVKKNPPTRPLTTLIARTDSVTR